MVISGSPMRQVLGSDFREIDISLAGCFEATAARHGYRPALMSGDQRWTYDELNAITNRLAHAIMARGSGRGDRVAILMAHDAPAIATMLAAVKTDRLVVVLNATHPTAQLREIVKTAEPSLIVTDDTHADLAMQIAEPALALLRFEEGSRHGNAAPPRSPSIRGSRPSWSIPRAPPPV